MREADQAWAAFGEFGRPVRLMEHEPDCPECGDHEQELSAHTREDLPAEALGTVGWSPLSHMCPEAVAHFMPRLAALALENVPDADGDPFAARFVMFVVDGPGAPRFARFGAPQRQAVYDVLAAVGRLWPDVVEVEGIGQELAEALGKWQA